MAAPLPPYLSTCTSTAWHGNIRARETRGTTFCKYSWKNEVILIMLLVPPNKSRRFVINHPDIPPRHYQPSTFFINHTSQYSYRILYFSQPYKAFVSMNYTAGKTAKHSKIVSFVALQRRRRLGTVLSNTDALFSYPLTNLSGSPGRDYSVSGFQ